MANVEATKKALATQPPQNTLQNMIEKSAQELGRALPEHMRPERLVRIALTCIRQTPELAKCTPESFLGALFTAAQLGVEPIAGRAYLLPFNNPKKMPNGDWSTVKEAQFVMGYRGLAELFYRHEKSVMLNWGVVKANDDFDYVLGTEAFLRHVPSKGDRGATVGFYVVADLGKAKPFHYMTIEECLDHGKKHSKTWVTKKWDKDQKRMVACEPQWADSSPWATNTDAMCLKTVLIQLCKVLPLSFEMARAIEQDETSREYRKGVADVLDTPSTTNWQEPPQADEPAEGAISQKTGKEIGFGE